MSSIGFSFEEAIESSFAAIAENHQYLSDLDKAIGDADHGINMLRGFTAVHDAIDDISKLGFSDACKQSGMVLLRSIGGASGPLYASFLIAAAKSGEEIPATQAELGAMFRAGIDSVKKRGKSDVGAKTIVDVLEPLTQALEANSISTVSEFSSMATSFAAETSDLVATKGRAAFLGERSKGHIDPGAMSCALIIEAICSNLETVKS